MKINQFFQLLSFLKQKKESSKEMLEKAEIKAKEIILAAKEKALKIEKEADDQAKKLTQEALEIERRLENKEREIETIRKRLEGEKRRLEEEKKQILTKKEEILTKLEKIAQLNRAEARDLIIRSWEEKLKEEIAKRIRGAEEEIKNKSDEKAKEILVDAMRYGAVDYTAEYTLSSINLPSEEFKGRIIGKEGRNIRAFELATGVDVDLDEEKVIKFSSFDAVRREIAKASMERLIRDGRIQPQRIEEIVKKTKEEIEKIIIKTGEDLCHRVGIHNLPFEIIKLLGKFKYRYSYGQNMIVHTLEEVKIGSALAHELKADVSVVKLGCLLHDIGKVITEKEGSHVQLGVELLKKYKFSQKVIECVASHHEDIPFPSVEAIIVYISDVISGSRPGARHEDFQEYLKRINTIEEIAKTKKGIVDAYALQAGRELRVIVKPEEISDKEISVLGYQIKEEIEEKFPTFPGQVKITIIRETRTQIITHG